MQSAAEFFDGYRRAFTTFDPGALAPLFAYPVQVASAADDAVEILVCDEVEWHAVISGLLEGYRAIGVADARVLEIDTLEVAPQLCSVRVHWELHRADASTIYDFTAVYTVIEAGGITRVAAIAHDELPKLMTAMGRAGA